MSYIAKIYLNKMFKKNDCLSIEGDQLKIKVLNVLNPIPLVNVPKNAYEHFELFGDGKLICGQDIPFKVEWKGKFYDNENASEVEGQILALGDAYTLYCKNPGWKSGETHELKIKIIQDRPIEIKISRTIA